jgi:hypothetical protein
MTVIYHLCGYDRSTDRLVEEHVVPAALLPVVRELVTPVVDDTDLILPYELTASAASTLARSLGVVIDSLKNNYCFEASDALSIDGTQRTATAVK